MGRVPRGQIRIGPRAQGSKRSASGRTAAAPPPPPVRSSAPAVVWIGGKRAQVFGSKPEAADEWAEPEHEPAAKRRRAEVAAAGLFDDEQFRHWLSTEVDEIDGDLRKARRDDNRNLEAAERRLESALRDATRTGEASILNKAIGDFGSAKQLALARKALTAMLQDSTLQPTAYTVANAVNAAVRCGETEEAMDYLTRASDWGAEANEVAYTALMKGLCGDGQQSRALALLGTMRNKGYQPNARTCATLCRGAMRNADASAALRLLKALREAGIDATKDGVCSEYLTKALVYGGRLDAAAGFVADGVANDAACACVATAAALHGRLELAKAAVAAARDPLRQSRGRGKDGGDSRSSALVFNRMRDSETRLELDRVEELVAKRAAGKSGRSAAATDWRKDPLVMFVDGTSTISRELFADPSLPLRVEVCMGNGEWVVERASREFGFANWIGVEIRPDRVYQAWTRRETFFECEDLLKKGPSNLMLVSGDARDALAAMLRGGISGDGGVEDLFVNFPEPPGWAGSKHNLLDPAFFKSVHSVLKVGGAVTVASDDALYSARTGMVLARLGRVGMYMPAVEQDGRPVSAKLPSGYGSSYFDKLWSSGSKSKRFFVHFVKPTPHVRGLLLAAAEETEFDSDGECAAGLSGRRSVVLVD